jgi:hypothetical protein
MIRWDPETERVNRQRELSIATALLREAESATDLETIRRLVNAAVMRLESLEPCPQQA